MKTALRIASDVDASVIRDRYRSCDDSVKRTHLQAIWLVASGRSMVDVSAVTGLCPRWLRELVNRFNRDGPDGLGDRRRGNAGAKPLLSGELEAGFRTALTGPPPGGGFWTGPKAAHWMARRLGLEKVHPQRGWDYLRRCGHTLQTPRPRHAKAATPEEQSEYKKTPEHCCRPSIAPS